MFVARLGPSTTTTEYGSTRLYGSISKVRFYGQESRQLSSGYNEPPYEQVEASNVKYFHP
jgi:hypothetical protein